jgi:c-di-GMP-binding flagellar brake protein YcgR
MQGLLCVEESRKNELIAEAIDRQTLCVISARHADGWWTGKSRFVAGPSVVGRMLIELPPEATAGDILAFSPGEKLGISFRKGPKKGMFSTVVLGRERIADEEAGAPVGGIEGQWPDALQEFQRRVYYRAVPPGRRIPVRLWPGGVAARKDVESAGQGVWSGTLWDLSAGGLRVLTDKVAGETFIEGERVGCSFTPRPRGETFVLDCLFRHQQAEHEGVTSVGLQFVGLEATEEGRLTLAKLARVVTEFQRGQPGGGRQRSSRNSHH